MSESYVRLIIREFKRLQSLADAAVSQLSDQQFFAIPSPGADCLCREALLWTSLAHVEYPARPLHGF